ncbi:MAG: glucuronate isomerase [Bacteroidales bacterium]|nr:glucuronate isomerase [Bacteroidales bacterium]
MKKFLDQNFLLETKTAEKLYHDHASKMPIIDYHCHLPPDEIASDRIFENITRIWLNGDHYKWRAMRAHGINEKYVTGDASDREKFEKWAGTVPYTLRNPLYHWTHLELQRYFDIDTLLDQSSARRIYDETREKLNSKDYSVRNLLRKMNVEVVCTTDDPVDSLEHHEMIHKDGFEIKVLPAWRPDKAMAVENIEVYNGYLDKLSDVSGTEIKDLNSLVDALNNRHDYFDARGCRLSDHGLESFLYADYNDAEIIKIFNNIRSGKSLNPAEIPKFKTAMLVLFAGMDHAKNWTQQFHVGAIRNNNSRMFGKLGPDTGYDSIGDFEMGRTMSAFLNRIDSDEKLTRTIVYNLNPRDNELMATMIYNFNDGETPGKMQFGSGWWFMDQKDGMEKQMNALSQLGLLSHFVGMLTDSRSFLSFPRHEYFRRILCNLIGGDMEKGELPNLFDHTSQMVENICYYNARNYFRFYE